MPSKHLLRISQEEKKQFFKDTKNPLFDDASSPNGCRNEQLYDF